MRSRIVLRLLICGIVWSVVPAASMAIGIPDITFRFTGVITEVDTPLTTEFSVGESVVGQYTFDPNTVDSLPSDPAQGRYVDTITAFTAIFGGDYTVTLGSTNKILVGNGSLNDSYSVFLDYPTAPDVAGLNLSNLQFVLIDTSATGFASDAIPLTPPDPAQFNEGWSCSIYYDEPLNQVMNFQLTSLTLVPEPATLVMTAIGFMCVACCRRRRGV